MPLSSGTSVDLEKAETMTCEQCGSSLFSMSYIIKRMSAIISPTGQESIIPIQVYSCDGCSKVPDIFMKELVRISQKLCPQGYSGTGGGGTEVVRPFPAPKISFWLVQRPPRTLNAVFGSPRLREEVFACHL